MINDKIKNLSAEENKMLKKVAMRTLALSASQNAETMQGFAYVNAMAPAIKLFNKDKKKRVSAYKRHFTIFNTNTTLGGFISGLTASMEKQAANDDDFDVASISAVKTALMGPIAGIGDSIFWGSVRTICTGIGLSFAVNGNAFGPLLMIVLYNAICTVFRYYGPYLGYIYGSDLISDMSENGILSKITKYATIVGMVTVGAMTCTMVGFSIPWEIAIGSTTISIQGMFDSILPNLVKLLLVLFVLKLLKKGYKSTWIIYAMLIIGVVGRYLGVL